MTITCAMMLIMMMLAAEGGSGFALKSAAFAPNAAIPSQHTCDGQDTSPPLEWSGEPGGAKSFALVMHDPDAPAGDWLHWVVWNIPSSAHALPANVAKKEALPDGTQQGSTDFHKPGYGGPCPPSGTHHYVFELHALDARLTLPANASRSQIEKEIQGHLLATAQLIGTYQRQKK
jgi:Raf kinase inhibitor-like YbhB/YbcL family protein